PAPRGDAGAAGLGAVVVDHHVERRPDAARGRGPPAVRDGPVLRRSRGSADPPRRHRPRARGAGRLSAGIQPPPIGEALTVGFETFKKNPVPILVGTLCAIIVSLIPIVGGG